MFQRMMYTVFWLIVVSYSAVAASYTVMDLVANKETGRLGKRGVALQFRHIENDPGNPKWSTRVLFQEQDETISYVPYKAGGGSFGAAAVGSFFFPPAAPVLLGSAATITLGKWGYNKLDYSNKASKVQMTYYISDSIVKQAEERLFTQHFPGMTLLEEQLPFRRMEFTGSYNTPPLLRWRFDTPYFDNLYQIVQAVDALKTNGEFPYYTISGASYWNDGLNCATFFVRFISNIYDGIDQIPSLKLYSAHEYVTLSSSLLPADSEYVIQKLIDNGHAIGNPQIFRENIKRIFPKVTIQ